MKTTCFVLFSVVFLCVIASQSTAFEFHWEIDETPEGQESVTVVAPIEVTILGEQIQLLSNTATYYLARKYSVYPDTSWDGDHTAKLFQTFESIPQLTNSFSAEPESGNISMWRLTDQHIQDDILIEYEEGIRFVTISKHAFVYANPLLAEIEGVRGRYFSKRLHHAVVRFVTNNGADRGALERILQERYAVSINVPDYSELTKHTTGEHSGRFSVFKNEELMALVSMLEEFPSGMLKTPGLHYFVRRLDGTPHPLYSTATAVAWPSAGYIEFMESAFKETEIDFVHRLILHEKAHFLWAHLFDEQLKQDWIELGGWYENPDDKDGWSTTKQTEFVSAYAHGVNPNEDMAESISFYIVRPDKLRSRSPAKYEFIQNRIMHGVRYISQIREDLTFKVYNLYPDYVYPGRIVRVDIQVNGEPKKDKQITIEIEIHKESDLDSAQQMVVHVWSEKGTAFVIWLYPINSQGQQISAGHVLRGHTTLSRFAANGYWAPDTMHLTDANGNGRYQSPSDFGWKLYIDNPLADCDPPEYVKNSMRLSLSEANEEGRPYQIVTARWQVIEEYGITRIYGQMNDNNRETYSRNENYGEYNPETNEASLNFIFPDYLQGGTYSLNYLAMTDEAGNVRGVYFTEPSHSWESEKNAIALDELPANIDIQTANPDTTPPVLDLNNITINAEPTNPEAPNGETRVDITFRIKDDISGYYLSGMYLRDPHGVSYGSYHNVPEPSYSNIYFEGDPTVFQTYQYSILLPVGSVPGTWGLAAMLIRDKALNRVWVDFTEIVRFKVDDGTVYAKSDVNEDGQINILDLLHVAQAHGTQDTYADVNGDGAVNILDLVQVASQIGEEDAAAPALYSATADQILSWLTQAMQADDGSPAFRKGIRALQNLLLKLRPETTALLPNYPNPFNPETWIPYHLANTSNVQITIYNTKGSIVRTLSLGHQAAGYYRDRDRAAYWDGRNSVGERIASGVYFYQLQADTISQLRKMVILK